MNLPVNRASRRSRSYLLTSVLPALCALALISCSRSETVPESETTTSTETRRVQVNRIDLGRAIGADSRITTTTESFAPRDTVYAAVVLAGPAPGAQVTARWTSPDGSVVTETTQTVPASEAEAVTEFHIVKPEGLAPGTYRVDILVDGQVASTKEFTIIAGS
jgi:hypothetical protein